MHHEPCGAGGAPLRGARGPFARRSQGARLARAVAQERRARVWVWGRGAGSGDGAGLVLRRAWLTCPSP
eukprot:3928174-Prymnesium_polylepis.1